MELHVMSHSSKIASLVLSCGLACAASAQNTQTNPLSQFDAEFDINSGRVVNTSKELTAVVSEIVSVQDADWLRLRFDEVTLAGNDADGNASYLQITSLEDGAVQYLDSESISQWQHTSAYFNGDTVLIELMAYPNSGFNEFNMSSVIAGTPPTLEESICGPTDDRILSSDPRAARALPIGCTAWMIDDCEHCFLTAGHCNGGGNSDINVLEFNVPLSDNSCSFGGINHPGPEDQYAVDSASQQTNGGGGVGNDWGYLGAFPNSNTGLLPWQVSGSWFTLNTSAPTATNARVTGYGSVSSSLASCAWYLVQKTHAGPFFSLSGNALGYGMDTTGGNSGSPVIDDTSGEAIGIHTHGGCSSGGGNNSGTWSGHPGLLNALANPQGVCEPQGPVFSFPGGLPEFIDPAGQSLDVNIAANGAIIPDPATAELVYDDGDGAVNIGLTHNGGDSYSVMLPGGDCFDGISYSFNVDDTNGMPYSNPNSSDYSGSIATGTVVTVDLDMNSDPGWTTSSTATTGAWERAIPGNYGRNDPTADADGSGFCWVTDNAANEDIDGGIVQLTTAAYDLSSSPDAVVSYAVHHDNTDASGNDAFTAEISNNNGTSWVTLETIPGSTAGWETHSFSISDFLEPTSQVVVRFTSQDLGTATIAESGIDAFRIITVTCDADDCLADVNGDGSVTPTDFTAWINAFNNNLPECDQNGDGSCTPTDFTAWIANFNAGC
jgi:V8-like Glu-specific endopeptidase